MDCSSLQMMILITHLLNGLLIITDNGFLSTELCEGEDFPVDVAPVGQGHVRFHLVQSGGCSHQRECCPRSWRKLSGNKQNLTFLIMVATKHKSGK